MPSLFFSARFYVRLVERCQDAQRVMRRIGEPREAAGWRIIAHDLRIVRGSPLQFKRIYGTPGTFNLAVPLGIEFSYSTTCLCASYCSLDAHTNFSVTVDRVASRFGRAKEASAKRESEGIGKFSGRLSRFSRCSTTFSIFILYTVRPARNLNCIWTAREKCFTDSEVFPNERYRAKTKRITDYENLNDSIFPFPKSLIINHRSRLAWFIFLASRINCSKRQALRIFFLPDYFRDVILVYISIWIQKI